MAVSEIEKLEARYAENPDGRYFAPLADAYRKAGRVDDAVKLVTTGLARHPDYLSAHIVLGRCQLDRKDDAAATAAFSRVLELDRENIIALKALAEIAERAGQPDDARRWLMRLLQVDGMNAEAEEDLQRLGGPLPEGEEAAAAAEAPALDLSFGDALPAAPSFAEAPTEPVPAIGLPPAAVTEASTLSLDAVPPPPEWSAPSPAPPPLAVEPSLPSPEPVAASVAPAPEPAAPVPPVEIEAVEFHAPKAEEVPPVEVELGSGVVPFDDQLAWGAGERSSRAIRQEDIIEAEARHEATTDAIEFVESAHGEAHVEATHLEVETPAMEIQHDDQEFDLSGRRGTASGIIHEEAPLPPEVPAEAGPPAGLPLIMPEEVTPAEEWRRPSAKQVQTVSPEPEPPAEGAEALVTETMGDLYLRQGFKAEAAQVYRRLLAQRPGDPGLTAKLASIESPPAMSAAALGTEAVGAWLRRIAGASLQAGAAAPPPPPPEGPSPMDSAFAAPEPEAPSAPAPVSAEPEPPGQPAREATNQFSLDQIFGAPAAPAPAPAAEAPKASAPSLGSSFDEFFGAGGPSATESARPRESTKTPRQSEDDLSAFNAWLHGLKR
jgi:tetratricopeptide (TPR) repeat protein